jgi:hypothetical protein
VTSSHAAATLALAAATLSALAFAGTAAAEPPHACPPNPAAVISQGAPSSGLLSRLAVLRRPQTAQDQLPSGFGITEPPLFGEGVYVNYIRHAITLDGTSYYLVPVQRALRAGRCPEGEEVDLVSYEPGGFRGWGGATARGLVEGKNIEMRWYAGRSSVRGVVPDGVARVTLRFKASGHRHVDAGVRVVNNVFAVAVPEPVAGSALPVSPSVVLWYSSRGRLLKKIRTGG